MAQGTIRVPEVPLTRTDELEILQAQAQRIRKNPALGVELAQKAGILNKNGELTEHYKRTG